MLVSDDVLFGVVKRAMAVQKISGQLKDKVSEELHFEKYEEIVGRMKEMVVAVGLPQLRHHKP
jgi:hypothetical protein